VPEDTISLIPDEQDAIDAALRMGRPGDLVLIFADALVRSWKQVIKFRPEGAPPPRADATGPTLPAAPAETVGESLADFDGLVRDERGVRVGREEAD